MNIQEAKAEIVRTYRAYTRRSADGSHRIPPEKQRPILLIGPPGIGKTAIMRQISEETGAGLVAYSMTHHTRQSAIGLPFISQRDYGGKRTSVTEYTMSEIVASIYDYMAATGKRSGILFLDEINCVSETLAPVMLQLLQNKTFGTHRIPEDWIIVAAGNPPEYNKSVRDLDMATLDRVKNMEIAADLGVWQEYALAHDIHPAIRTYLTVYPDHFYNITNSDRGQLFVTARGWEDLSCILLAYEEENESVGSEFFLQYLQHDEIARSFGMYYDLFAHFSGEGDLASRLRDHPEELREFTATQCLAAAAMLFHGIETAAGDWAGALSRLDSLAAQIRLLPPDLDFADEERKSEFFRSRRQTLDVRVQHDVIKPEEELRERWVLDTLERSAAEWIKGDRSAPFTDHAAEQIAGERARLDAQARSILSQIEAAYAVLEQCPRGRSAALYLTTDLSGCEATAALLKDRPCEAWLRYCRELLKEE
ncbi:MAG: AAA family ATPase [Oscillospiraceae bacterium]|nr:AAA family ATPase [Oscillospiraceae bacterium]